MRIAAITSVFLLLSSLAGCASAPNQPTLTLDTQKTPEAYAACLVPKLQAKAFDPNVSQTNRHFRIVVSSSLAADNIVETFKTSTGAKVVIYQRSLFAPDFVQTAKECV